MYFFFLFLLTFFPSFLLWPFSSNRFPCFCSPLPPAAVPRPLREAYPSLRILSFVFLTLQPHHHYYLVPLLVQIVLAWIYLRGNTAHVAKGPSQIKLAAIRNLQFCIQSVIIWSRLPQCGKPPSFASIVYLLSRCHFQPAARDLMAVSVSKGCFIWHVDFVKLRIYGTGGPIGSSECFFMAATVSFPMCTLRNNVGISAVQAVFLPCEVAERPHSVAGLVKMSSIHILGQRRSVPKNTEFRELERILLRKTSRPL